MTQTTTNRQKRADRVNGLLAKYGDGGARNAKELRDWCDGLLVKYGLQAPTCRVARRYPWATN